MGVLSIDLNKTKVGVKKHFFSQESLLDSTFLQRLNKTAYGKGENSIEKKIFNWAVKQPIYCFIDQRVIWDFCL